MYTREASHSPFFQIMNSAISDSIILNEKKNTQVESRVSVLKFLKINFTFTWTDTNIETVAFAPPKYNIPICSTPAPRTFVLGGAGVVMDSRKVLRFLATLM